MSLGCIENATGVLSADASVAEDGCAPAVGNLHICRSRPGTPENHPRNAWLTCSRSWRRGLYQDLEIKVVVERISCVVVFVLKSVVEYEYGLTD